MENNMTCPICKSNKTYFSFSSIDKYYPDMEDEFIIYGCRDCNLFFQNPQPSEEILDKHYPVEYGVYLDFSEKKRHPFLRNFVYKNVLARWLGYDRKRWWQWCLFFYWPRVCYYPKWVGKGGKVLDIGCANGRFLTELRSLGWKVMGTDISKKAVESARKHNINVFVGELENIKGLENYFDAIILHHVFEHVRNPLTTLIKIKEMLKTGGEVIITTPNAKSLLKKLFGKDWFWWEIPRHTYVYSEKNIKILLKGGGLRMEKIYYPFFMESFSTSMQYKFKIKNTILLRILGKSSQIMQLLFSWLANGLKIGDAITVRAIKCSNIEGWLSLNEANFLYCAAKKCSGKGVIVEIGSWKGKSTICLAKGSQAGHRAPIYAIDPHIGAPEHHIIISPKIWTFEEFKKNIKEAGAEDIVHPIVDRSENVAKNWDKPIELLWIDGAHAYQSALLDFESWYPHLIDGGIVAYHDTFGEVQQVVKEKIWLSDHFKNCGLVDSIAFAAKSIAPINRWQKIKNRWILFLSNMQDLGRNLPLPKFIRKIIKALSKKILNSRI